jgi:hypothetical protein
MAEATSPKGQVWRDVIIASLIFAAVAFAYIASRHRHATRLNAFDQCLAVNGAKMYGAYWCPHCADQKELLGSGFKAVPYVECGIPGSRDEDAVCKSLGVKRFPTWEFSSGERKEGLLQLNVLSEKTGCPLP